MRYDESKKAIKGDKKANFYQEFLDQSKAFRERAIKISKT
jgi:hypothetical protein